MSGNKTCRTVLLVCLLHAAALSYIAKYLPRKKNADTKLLGKNQKEVCYCLTVCLYDGSELQSNANEMKMLAALQKCA